MREKLEQARNLLDPTIRGQDEAPSEASLFERALALREAEKLVNEVLGASPGDPEALVLHARLASHLKDWDLAIVRWNHVLREVPTSKDEAHYNLNIAYRNTGSLHRAHSALDKVRSKPLVSKVERERSRLERHESEVAARVIGNHLVAALKDGATARKTAPLLDTLLLLRADGEVTAACIRSITSSLQRERPKLRIGPRRNRPVTACETALNPSRSVFFCGFGWSGSGALYDYFRQSDKAVEPFGRTEVLVFHGDWSVQRVLDLAEKDPGHLQQALVAFVYHTVLGVGGRRSLEATLSRNKSLIKAFEGNRQLTQVLASASTELLLYGTGAANPGRDAGVEDAIRGFFDRLMSAKVRAGEVGLVNNVIHPQHVDLVRLVSNARLFAVFRDPRDQYVSRVFESRDGRSVSSGRFITELRAKHAAYKAALELAQGKVEEVQFEEFVLSSAARATLADKIGLSVPRRGSGYHPEDSAGNVGVHKSYPDVSAIRRIEDEFGQWLFKA